MCNLTFPNSFPGPFPEYPGCSLFCHLWPGEGTYMLLSFFGALRSQSGGDACILLLQGCDATLSILALANGLTSHPQLCRRLLASRGLLKGIFRVGQLSHTSHQSPHDEMPPNTSPCVGTASTLEPPPSRNDSNVHSANVRSQCTCRHLYFQTDPRHARCSPAHLPNSMPSQPPLLQPWPVTAQPPQTHVPPLSMTPALPPGLQHPPAHVWARAPYMPLQAPAKPWGQGERRDRTYFAIQQLFLHKTSRDTGQRPGRVIELGGSAQVNHRAGRHLEDIVLVEEPVGSHLGGILDEPPGPHPAM